MFEINESTAAVKKIKDECAVIKYNDGGGNKHQICSPTDAASSEYSGERSSRNLTMLKRSSTIATNYDFSHSSFRSESSNNSSIFLTKCTEEVTTEKLTGECGIQIALTTDDDDNFSLDLKYHQDCHLPYIHPHVFVPSAVRDVRRMAGGGSGVAVFCGEHRDIGEIVMKHGTFEDLEELFALVHVSKELKKRGEECPSRSRAAQSMIACLPEFKMLYISPQHVLFKRKALWSKLRKLIRIGNLLSRVSDMSTENDKQPKTSFISLLTKMREESDKSQCTSEDTSSSLPSSASLYSLDDSAFLTPGMSIRIYQSESGAASLHLDEKDSKDSKEKGSLTFTAPKDRIKRMHPTGVELECSEEFDSLQQIYDDLSSTMSKHLFKFTLAQKKIGGRNATTGNQWLYKGKLKGETLGNLISKFVQTIHNLQALTPPEEVDVFGKVYEEIQEIKSSNIKVADISSLSDQFMGNSIKKNFHPRNGRFHFLQQTCRQFRDDTVFLLPEEELPAKHLKTLVEPNASLSEIFVDSSSNSPIIFPDDDFCILMMTVAAASERKSLSPNATRRIWTSGLSDAGIHNLFVSNDDLYFFDLGVPQLLGLCGFMTKFLFSFFHVLGMQENKESNNEWVHRFVPQGDRLSLTEETKEILEDAYSAFEAALNRIIEEIFDGDQGLRWLLLQYVTLQLLSDASFCLQRWKMKGGGRTREENHHMGLERWLWRSLWDTYIAFHINTKDSWIRLKIEHPSPDESNNS